MSRVNEWFPAFIRAHMKRNPGDWPTGDEAPLYFEGWRKNLVMHGVTPEVAEEASIALMSCHPGYRGEYLKAFLDACSTIFKARAEEGKGAGDPRKDALAASAGCDDCCGHGLTLRWRRKSAAEAEVPFITCYCTCPYGRWLKEMHRKDARDVHARIYDLARYPWLQGEEYRHPPELDRIMRIT